MIARLHRFALRCFARLPRSVRRRMVRHITPNYTVGAICVIERADGAVLLVRQAYRERWGVPGGLLNRGEDAPAGARREVREEVGIDVELLGEPAVVVEPAPQRIDIVFRARPVGEVPVEATPTSPEIVEARWFAPDDLPELQHETSAALVALARSSRSPQARSLGEVVDPARALHVVREQTG
jgi:8-oxo-dGTP pyrophosphatase MutT (NUDIX family)